MLYSLLKACSQFLRENCNKNSISEICDENILFFQWSCQIAMYLMGKEMLEAIISFLCLYSSALRANFTCFVYSINYW